jgi:hypothetical protein
MTNPTPVTSPSTDQQVQYFSADAPLNATIVNIWDDGPVDVVVDDASLPNPFLVKRIVYVPFGGTFVPLNDFDTRYVAQLTTGSGLPAGDLQDTAPTEDGPAAVGVSTEPLES